MGNNLRSSSLIPAGLLVESIKEDEDVIVVFARARAEQRACPFYGTLSAGVHIRYIRTAADRLCGGKELVPGW